MNYLDQTWSKTQPYCIIGVNLRISRKKKKKKKKKEEKMAFQVGRSFYMS